MQLSPAEMSALHIRRLAFELALTDLRVQGALIGRSSPDRYPDLAVCPCCGYPTLYARGYFDICCLCGWEDDGQDDPKADDVLGGPNHDYSLTEARRNFIDNRTQYRPADIERFERETALYHARTKLIDAFDTLLPIVHPWTFISALPEVERLERAIDEIKFGKKPRSIAPRDPGVVQREREYRDWDVWALLAEQTLAPYRHSVFMDVPPMEREKDRAFAGFVDAVAVRLQAIAAERNGDVPERIFSFRACTEWMRDDRTATLTRFGGYESIGLSFWPVEDTKRMFYRYDDGAAHAEAAERIARYFGIRSLRAAPDPVDAIPAVARSSRTRSGR